MKTSPLLLFVPVVWSSLGFAASAPLQPSSVAVWQQSQKTNAFDDFTYSRFTLMGNFVTPSSDAMRSRPAFVLDCVPAEESRRGKGTFLAANLRVGTNLKVMYVESEDIPSGITGMSYFPKIAVRYRIDNARKEEQGQWSPTSDKNEYQWSPGSDQTSASIPKHSVEEILHARKVVITTNDDHGRKVVVRFDMPDPTLVEKVCREDERKG
jgi:hypothetical protein